MFLLLAYIDGYGATKSFPHFEAAPNLEACGLVSMDLLPWLGICWNFTPGFRWENDGASQSLVHISWPKKGELIHAKSLPTIDHGPGFLGQGPVVHPSLPVESLASKICKKTQVKKPTCIIWDYTTHKNGHFGDGLWWFISHYTDSPKDQLVRSGSYGSTNGARNFGRGHVCSFPSKDHQEIDPITFPMLPSCCILENRPEMQIIVGESERKTMDLPWIFHGFSTSTNVYMSVFQCELFRRIPPDQWTNPSRCFDTWTRSGISTSRAILVLL